MIAGKMLIIDDEEAITWSLCKFFERLNYQIQIASSVEKAYSLLKQDCPDVIILDIRLPGQDGLSALKTLSAMAKFAPIILITAHGNLSTAVQAITDGAFDYLAKPFDLQEIRDCVTRALQFRQKTTGTILEIAKEKPAEAVAEMIGKSLPMQNVYKRIALVAPHDASVLITGESGTGKELVARAIHRYSLRKDQVFLPVHVASLNPNLVESELFGHAKGSFTNATQEKEGLLVLANKGTLFLDELADIPLAVQAKLLRVLEHQEVLPVGSNQPRKIDVRILAATHQDLHAQISQGNFRHDLFYRLNVFEVHLPPLRDRFDDLPLLAETFLKRLPNSNQIFLPSETLSYLAGRSWPGNVRQFRNAIEHAAIIARHGPLLPEHFPQPLVDSSENIAPEVRFEELFRSWVQQKLHQLVEKRGADKTTDEKKSGNLYDQTLALLEPILLDEVLKHTHQQRISAARILGLARATLRKWISRYRPQDPLPEEEPSESGE